MKTFYSILFFTISISLFAFSCKLNAQGGKKLPAPATAQKTSAATIDESRTFNIPVHYNGYNAQMMRGPAWRDEGFISQVKRLHPRLIRYPGGTNSSYWDWKTGWLMDGIELKKDYKSIRKNPNTLNDLKFACDSTGAVPVFVLNMMTSNLDYQMQMLRSAKSIGLPVLYVELDNEVYLGEKFYVARFATGEAYAKECNKWIAAIKKEFPGVRISVSAFSSRESAAKKARENAGRTATWNRDVIASIKNADAMTFHLYGGSGLNFLGGKSVFSESDDDDNGRNEEQANELQRIFDEENSVQVMLGVPFSRWKTTMAYDQSLLPKNMKAWYTEYNLFEREGVAAGTWAHGLYAVTQTLLFAESSKTEMICYHNLTTSAQFAALFNTSTGFHKSVKKKPTDQFGFTAAGYGLWLTGKAFNDGKYANKLNFSVNPPLKGARAQEYPSLYGWVVKNDARKKIIVVNLSPDHIITDFTKVVKGNITSVQVSSDPKTQVATEADVKITRGKSSSLSLVPYSVTFIEGE